MNRRRFIGAIVGAGAAIKAKALELLDWNSGPFYGDGETLCGTGVESPSLAIYPRYFDRAGNPMGLMEWATKMEDMNYRRIALTHLPNYKYVSTVWLGLDHGFRLTGKPQEIFETMAFEEELKFHPPGEIFKTGFHYHEEVDCERWATESEALRGHQRMCERICPGSLTLGVGGEI